MHLYGVLLLMKFKVWTGDSFPFKDKEIILRAEYSKNILKFGCVVLKESHSQFVITKSKFGKDAINRTYTAQQIAVRQRYIRDSALLPYYLHWHQQKDEFS